MDGPYAARHSRPSSSCPPSKPASLTLIVLLLLVLASPAGGAPVNAAPPYAPADAGALEPLPPPGGSALEPAEPTLPLEASTDWWSAVQRDIAQSEYEITWQEQAAPAGADLPGLGAGYQAPNRAQNLRTYFTADGIRVIPREFDGEQPPWTWVLRLVSVNGQAVEASGGPASVSASEHRIEFARGGLTEWYVNDESGVEQGFTLASAPERGPGIAVQLALSGNLTAELSADGDAVELSTAGGERVLRYAGLLAVDATGRELPARLELDGAAVTLRVDDADAVYPVNIDPTITGLSTTANWTAESDQAYAWFGYSVGTAGDVNGDGYADVIVGAYLYDTFLAGVGRAFVYLGSASGLSATAAWTAESDQANASFGYSVSGAGDVNGDGYADVIVGAPYYYDNGQTSEGRAFVYLGSASGLGAAGTPANADWAAESDQAYANFGSSVGTAGDVNHDGYADVIVGAQFYDHQLVNEGGVFVYMGSASGLSASAAWTAASDQADAYFGVSVGSAGDVNGDGYADVIVGAWQYDTPLTNAGGAFVYFGGPSAPGDLSGLGAAGTPANADWTAVGGQASAHFGYSVSTAGDVDGDGYADVIVGAHQYRRDYTYEGGAFVYLGSASGLSASPAWTAVGGQASAYFGISVSTAGDVNGDGYADVVVGAQYYDNPEPNEGRAFVYLGSASGLSGSAAWTAESDQRDASFGVSVGAAGDVNGDGYADVIVGAYQYERVQTDEGCAFVYYGRPWTMESDQANAHFGYSVGTAGDVNGDGYADVIAGVPDYDNGQFDEGRVYIYLGSAGGLDTLPAWIVESDQATASFGYSVGTAGDVNGDGYADVIVGAHHYDNVEANEGRAFVYLGSASGLGASAAWTAESDQEGAYFGRSVGTAGDVNGDGYADVIVGADPYDYNSLTNAGGAFVYFGGPSAPGDLSGLGPPGTPANADWQAYGDQAFAAFGISGGTAGDVNGDGYADVIVGAYQYGNGQQYEGRAFVYLGSAGGLSSGAAWTAESDQAWAFFGGSVGTAGDVNGDGYADVIVGAAAYGNGRALVYLGSANGLSAGAAWTAESDQAGANFGWSVGTAGDVNGDGYADVVVGAHTYDHDQTDEGRAFVYLGSASGLGANAAWTAESNQANAYFGYAVSTAGDVNGDGYADVIVGAYQYDNPEADEGHAFVYLGSASGLATAAGWTAESDQASANFGYSVGTAGDVNGDGYADVVVGADLYDYNSLSDAGRAFVYLGSATGLGTTPAWTAGGNGASAQFGASVGAAGDVNGDGYADVIVGAPGYAYGQTAEGAAFVYLGNASGLRATPSWGAEPNLAGAHYGVSVGTAGDVNGDGYADVIVGAPDCGYGQTGEGVVFVYLGSASGPGTTPIWRGESDQVDAHLGRSVGAAGDVNGDGYADVIVGANGYDGGQTDEGRALVYLGSASGLGGSAAWTAESNQASAYFGASVGTAGDVNGDGYADVIVGATWYDNDQADEGRAFVYLGSASGLGPAGTPANAAWTGETDQADAHFGISVGAAGDVNGDGYGDVIVGAHYYDHDQPDEGRAFVYLGSASGLSASAAWTAESDQASAYFGFSLGTAGDVNGDGYADVIVGAYQYDKNLADDGAAFLYYGGGGRGLAVAAQPRRADDSAPVAPGGQSFSPTQARLAVLGRTPFGRNDVALQWEVKPVGTAFNGSGLGQSAWTDSGTAGASLNQLVDSLAFETRYRWRVRLLGRPRGAATNSAITYRSRWLYGSSFFTALSGAQAIAGGGVTNLLGRSAYVNVTNLGSPAFTSLALRGYPNTLAPNISALAGYGDGTTKVLARYFSLEPNAGAAGYALALCLNYDDAEVAASGATEANLQLCRWNGSAWYCPPRSPSSDTTANLVCADNISAFSNWAIAGGTPLAADLEEQTATARDGGIRVAWRTVSEIDNLGFNIWRSATPDAPVLRLNEALIPSQAPGSGGGYAYAWDDRRDLVPGMSYWYWVESVGMNGETSLRGPVAVTYAGGEPNAIGLGGLSATSGGGGAGWTTLVVLLAFALLRMYRGGRRRRRKG